MEIEYVTDYETLSKLAATEIAAQIRSKPNSVLGLATGGTPEGTYDELVRMNAAGEVDFSLVTTFNLDEYCGISGADAQSYRFYMDERLFNRVNIAKERTHLPDGNAKDPARECTDYEQRIKQSGGIDLQLLGIGHNGHIGFNEPGVEYARETHVEELTEETIKANTRFFEKAEEVPRRAITMGIGTIMQARRILLIASGADKASILARAISGAITPQVPASVLQLHRSVRVIAAVR